VWLAGRRDTYSPERAAATGYGILTASQGYIGDLRVRRLAGIDDGPPSSAAAWDPLPDTGAST